MIRVDFVSKILMALISASVATPASAQQPLTKVVLASPSTDDITPVLYAQKNGIFRKYGLDVELSHMNSGAAIIAAMSGGSVNLGAVSLLGAINAYVRGVPIQLFAPAGLYEDDQQALLITRKSAAFQNGKDLEGKTIGSPAIKDLNALATMAWIDQHGGDSRLTKIVEIPASAILPALEEGRVDVATVQVPSLTAALDSGKIRVLGKSWTAIAPRFHDSAWVVSPEWAAKNPQVADRFNRAVREAAAYTDTHHAETLDLIAAFTGLDSQMLGRGARSRHPQYIDPVDVQPVIEFMIKYKLIDKSFDAKELINPGALRPRPKA